jgi:hypothetical protein
VKELLACTMEVAVTLNLIIKKELTRVIVDSTAADHRMDRRHLKESHGDAP